MGQYALLLPRHATLSILWHLWTWDGSCTERTVGTTSRTYHGQSWLLIKHDRYEYNNSTAKSCKSWKLPTSLFRLAMSILWPSCEFPHTKKICTRVFLWQVLWPWHPLTHASTSSWLTNALREAPLGSMKVMFSASCLRGKRPLVSSNVLRYLKIWG